MPTGKHLDDLHKGIVPTDAEKRAVQLRVDDVIDILADIAEVHPAGSWAKSTMLKGRKEADIVLVLSKAPDDRTLEEFAAELGRLSGLKRKPDTSFKAVQLEFDDGVLVDVLPVAQDGRTPDGPSVPRKLRHALSGIKHVEWLKREAHGTVLHPVIRLTKHFRNTHAHGFHDMSSFAIEVMCVEMKLTGDLSEAFTEVLRKLGDGWLAPDGRLRKLLDPVESGNDLLADLDVDQRRDIADCATAALAAIEASSWSQVFPTDKGTLPPPGSNLGGRTLG